MTAVQAPNATSQDRSSALVLRGFRVCLLAGTLGQGGAERQLFYALKCLIESSAAVNLLSLTKDEYWEAPIRKLGVPVHFVGSAGSRLGRVLKISRTICQLQPQLIQCQHFYTNIYGAVAGRCLRIPSIGAVRSDGLSELQSNGRFLGKLCLGLPALVAANSARAIQNLTSLGHDPRKFVLIPNVVDTEYFQPGPEAGHERPFTILGVGSLESPKRFDRFLEIAVRLKGQTSGGVRAIIAGDGTLRGRIEDLAGQARQKGVAVQMMGRVTDPLTLYQSADVLLLSSDWEGTPNVIMEAKACGLPVVATNVGGVSDLVKAGKTGFLFEPDDCANAVAALERLARNPGLAREFGARARAFIKSYHSCSLLPGILAGLYQTILSPER